MTATVAAPTSRSILSALRPGGAPGLEGSGTRGSEYTRTSDEGARGADCRVATCLEKIKYEGEMI